MATAGKSGAGDKVTAPEGMYPARQPSRWKRNLALVALVALAGSLAFAWQGMREEALAGAAYGAHAGCVCRFVSQRPIAACEADLKVAGLGGIAGMVSLSEDASSRTVTGAVPLFARQSADYREGRGCQLEPWRD